VRSVGGSNAADGNCGESEQSEHYPDQPSRLDDTLGYDSASAGKYSAWKWDAVDNAES
jgi:hypothetical protein